MIAPRCCDALHSRSRNAALLVGRGRMKGGGGDAVWTRANTATKPAKAAALNTANAIANRCGAGVGKTPLHTGLTQAPAMALTIISAIPGRARTGSVRTF